MRKERLGCMMTVCGMLLATGLAPLAAGQNASGFPVPGGAQTSPLERGSSRDKDPTAGKLQEQLAKTRNDDRQRKLVDDTARLYQLSSELKDQVAKTDKNMLSVDVVRKAEEIEKLARSVKEKMKGQGA